MEKISPQAYSTVLQEIDKRGETVVLVELSSPELKRSLQENMSDSVRKASVTTVHEQLRSSLSADDQQRIVHQYEFVSTIAIRVNAESLERLKQNDAAAGVYQNGWNQAFLSQSTKLVFPNQAMSKFTGNNEWAVAVLDTGVDKYHSFLKTGAAQKVVSEACYSRGGLPTTDPRIDSFCPGEGFSSTAVDSGLNCTGYSG